MKTAPLPVDLPASHSRWKRFTHRVHGLHVGRRGDYSVERLIALEAYCRDASFLRVLLVFVAFPLPALGMAILIECIPLKDPKEGWQANYAAFIRYMLVCTAIAICCALQIRQMVPGIKLSPYQVVCVSIGAATCTTGTIISLSSQWVFPVPFGLVVASPVFPLFFFIFFRLALGGEQIQASTRLGQCLKQQVAIILVEVSTCVVYPAFSAVYNSLSSTGKTLFVGLLPIIKLVMQNVMAWAAKNLEQYIAGITVLSIEGFNALYLSKCMQSGTFLTYLVIMAFDILESIMAFTDMQEQANAVFKLKNRSDLIESKLNMLQELVELCKEPDILRANGNFAVRLRSPVLLQFSEKDMVLFEQICDKYGQGKGKTIATKPSTSKAKISVSPVNMEIQQMEIQHLTERKESGKSQSEKTSIVQNQELIQQALKLLFATEYHALVEYIECIVPIIYAVYVTALVHLSDAAYFPETRYMTSGQVQIMANSILLYAGLEVVSFIGLHYAIKRKSGFSPAYLLAFVLENQWVEFQARVVIWILFVLMLTLQHFGVDFTLQFEWLHH